MFTPEIPRSEKYFPRHWLISLHMLQLKHTAGYIVRDNISPLSTDRHIVRGTQKISDSLNNCARLVVQ